MVEVNFVRYEMDQVDFDWYQWRWRWLIVNESWSLRSSWMSTIIRLLGYVTLYSSTTIPKSSKRVHITAVTEVPILHPDGCVRLLDFNCFKKPIRYDSVYTYLLPALCTIARMLLIWNRMKRSFTGHYMTKFVVQPPIQRLPSFKRTHSTDVGLVMRISREYFYIQCHLCNSWKRYHIIWKLV